MRKGRDGEKNGKKTGGKKTGKKREKTDGNSGHYVIASSRPPERRTLVPICLFPADPPTHSGQFQDHLMITPKTSLRKTMPRLF